MSRKEKKKLEASYYLNRVDMMRNLKGYLSTLEKIANEGIEDAEEERIARIACSVLASDFHYEDSLMNKKRRGGDYNPLINPPS